MRKEIIKPLVSIIVVLLGSCSTILEVEEQQNNERIVKEPSVVSQLDSVSFIRVKSTIQARWVLYNLVRVYVWRRSDH